MSKICSPHEIVEKHVHVVQFFHRVPHGLSPDGVFGDGTTYWANAWKRFEGKESSTVEFLAEDGSWEAEARILKAEPGKVQFRVLRLWREEPTGIETPEGYRVEFIAESGWRAVDPAGSVVIAARAMKAEALTAALDHATAYSPKRKKAAA